MVNFSALARTDGAERVAVFVAHPGHELMVYHWLEQQRPLYCCLTDGSGGEASSRLASTRRLLGRIGATSGSLCGRYSDKEVYRLLLEKRLSTFVELSHELAEILIQSDVDAVAGDAVEGFNPVHDVCRFIIDGAVACVERRTGRKLTNRDFVLDSNPDCCPDSLRSDATWMRLDDATLNRKVEAGMDYPELREEINFVTQRFGTKAFALECLRPAHTELMLQQFEEALPLYEHFGAIRQQEGRYQDIIRYRAHVLPVRNAIEESVRG